MLGTSKLKSGKTTTGTEIDSSKLLQQKLGSTILPSEFTATATDFADTAITTGTVTVGIGENSIPTSALKHHALFVHLVSNLINKGLLEIVINTIHDSNYDSDSDDDEGPYPDELLIMEISVQHALAFVVVHVDDPYICCLSFLLYTLDLGDPLGSDVAHCHKCLPDV